MSMKKLLQRAARTPKQKAQVERMSEAEARRVLQKHAEILKKEEENRHA